MALDAIFLCPVLRENENEGCACLWGISSRRHPVQILRDCSAIDLRGICLLSREPAEIFKVATALCRGRNLLSAPPSAFYVVDRYGRPSGGLCPKLEQTGMGFYNPELRCPSRHCGPLSMYRLRNSSFEPVCA